MIPDMQSNSATLLFASLDLNQPTIKTLILQNQCPKEGEEIIQKVQHILQNCLRDQNFIAHSSAATLRNFITTADNIINRKQFNNRNLGVFITGLRVLSARVDAYDKSQWEQQTKGNKRFAAEVDFRVHRKMEDLHKDQVSPRMRRAATARVHEEWRRKSLWQAGGITCEDLTPVLQDYTLPQELTAVENQIPKVLWETFFSYLFPTTIGDEERHQLKAEGEFARSITQLPFWNKLVPEKARALHLRVVNVKLEMNYINFKQLEGQRIRPLNLLELYATAPFGGKPVLSMLLQKHREFIGLQEDTRLVNPLIAFIANLAVTRSYTQESFDQLMDCVEQLLGENSQVTADVYRHFQTSFSSSETDAEATYRSGRVQRCLALMQKVDPARIGKSQKKAARVFAVIRALTQRFQKRSVQTFSSK